MEVRPDGENWRQICCASIWSKRLKPRKKNDNNQRDHINVDDIMYFVKIYNFYLNILKNDLTYAM